MTKSHELPGRVIFPKGERIAGEGIANDHFTGTVWLQVLVPPENIFNCPTFNVTFEPGARNNWHRHPGGQILLVTGGLGYYHEEGNKVRIIREGDVVKIPRESNTGTGLHHTPGLPTSRSVRTYNGETPNGWNR